MSVDLLIPLSGVGIALAAAAGVKIADVLRRRKYVRKVAEAPRVPVTNMTREPIMIVPGQNALGWQARQLPRQRAEELKNVNIPIQGAYKRTAH